MDKRVINVPGADALATTQSRLGFLKTLAAASVGMAAGSAILSREARAQSGGDIDVINFALTLELLERDFYQLALDAGVLSGDALGVVTNLRDHEQAHVDFLTAAGGSPIVPPQFVFPPESLASQEGVLNTAIQLEPVGVGAYLGAAPLIADPATLEAALSIYGTENDHVVAVKNLLGVVPPAQTAFQSPLTQDQVLAAIAPFLGGAATSPADPASSTPAPSTGGTSTSTGNASASA